MKEQVCGDHERKIDNWDHEYMGVRKAVPGNIQHNNDIAHACRCRQDSPRLAVWAADTPADQHGALNNSSIAAMAPPPRIASKASRRTRRVSHVRKRRRPWPTGPVATPAWETRLLRRE